MYQRGTAGSCVGCLFIIDKVILVRPYVQNSIEQATRRQNDKRIGHDQNTCNFSTERKKKSWDVQKFSEEWFRLKMCTFTSLSDA